MDTNTDHFTPLILCIWVITETHQNMDFVVGNVVTKWNECYLGPLGSLDLLLIMS